MLDLKEAIVLSPSENGVENKAAQVLMDEVEKRTGLRWSGHETWPPGDTPVIFLGKRGPLEDIIGQGLKQSSKDGEFEVPEGYELRVDKLGKRTVVLVLGNDHRGVMYGVGHLLRVLEMDRDWVTIEENLHIRTAPRYKIRGHQLGYRDKTNSYCGWNLEQWEQYIRDLVVFGANAIELIPPRSDDRPDSVHFPQPPMETMRGMSRIADEYGIDVWIWFPAMDQDYTKKETVKSSLREWAKVFDELPRIDALMIPGGDPGNTRPRVLFDLLEKQASSLNSYHPEAQIWVSPQGFSDKWMSEFLELLNEGPKWLKGVVFGPWIHMNTHEFRDIIPDEYPIRHYPDITHTLSSQYPVPEWDIAYALTEGREVINPRPRDQSVIFRATQTPTIGFITYSEGCHDDVNKCIWSCLGWDPDMDVMEILRQYSRYFIGKDYANDFALGLLALEENWRGPLADNEGVYTTLGQFKCLESSAQPRVLKNWRFLQGLYRAYYDSYVRSRLLYEKGLEEKAVSKLRESEDIGSLMAVREAERILDRSKLEGVSHSLLKRIFQLAEALFQSIHMQLSVDLYMAQSEVRGANLDGVNFPLNNAPWLRLKFEEVREAGKERDRRRIIEEILGWRNPGPGGFYDNLGSSFSNDHVVKGPGFENDPGLWRRAFRQYPYQKVRKPLPLPWRGFTGTLKDTPFEMRYEGLDPNSEYKVRIVYSNLSPSVKVRLETTEGIEIHTWIEREGSPRPRDFDIPPEATGGGTLNLRWLREPGKGGPGRGCQISEIWIMKKDQ